MKTIFFNLVAVVMIITSCSGNTTGNKTDNPMDGVKSMKEITLDVSYKFTTPQYDTTAINIKYYDDQGRVVKEEKYGEQGLESLAEYTYEGNTEIRTSTAFLESGENVHFKTTTIYNDDMKPLVVKESINNGREFETNYEYDASGLLIKETDSSGSSEYEYNENNQLVRESHFLEGELARTVEYYYNDKNQDIKDVTVLYGYGEPLSSTGYYEYDDEGRIIKSTSDGGVFVEGTTTYEYEEDKAGRLTKKSTSVDGAVVEVVCYEYTL